MTATARANGWHGFDGIGEKVPGGYQYDCDGMPTLMGCAGRIIVPRRWARVGKKKASGWLVCYGLEPIRADLPLDDPANLYEDKDVVLTFCPSCTTVVEGARP